MKALPKCWKLFLWWFCDEIAYSSHLEKEKNIKENVQIQNNNREQIFTLISPNLSVILNTIYPFASFDIQRYENLRFK